jgi:hypothetical protein
MHVLLYLQFGFHLFLPPLVSTPLTSGPRPTDHRVERRAPGANDSSDSPRSPWSPRGDQLYLKASAAGIGYLFALAFSRRRSALLSSLALFAICLLLPALSSLPASLQSFPLHLQQSPPCLLLAIPTASSVRNSSTQCAASWGGPRRSSPGRSGQARAPSMTWSRGSSSSSSRTSPAG